VDDAEEQRLRVLRAIRLAQNEWAQVLAVVAASPDDASAVTGLRARFDLDETQAEAVLATPFRRLSRVHREQVRSELGIDP